MLAPHEVVAPAQAQPGGHVTGIAGAVEVATAIHSLRPGHVTPGQLRAILIDHLTIESLVQLGALSEVLVRTAAARVDLLLANQSHLALALVAAAAGEPLTSKDLGLDYDTMLRTAGEANARRG